MFNRTVMLKQLLQGANIFSFLLAQQQAEVQRHYEQRLKELALITNADYRDQAIAEMLLDKLLVPDAPIRIKLQNTAKYVQYLAEELPYKASEHNLTEVQMREICSHLRYLARLLSETDSLYQLRMIYAVTLSFVDVIADFRHRERQHSIQHALRHHVLESLNDCIANQQNFLRRPNIRLTFICQPNEAQTPIGMNDIMNGTVRLTEIKRDEYSQP